MERTSCIIATVAFASAMACAQATEGNVLQAKDGGPDAPTATDTGTTPSGDAGGFDVGDPDAGPPTLNSDPKTCDEAATYKSYVGCDYWPTVTSNVVWSIFDFAVVVANAGDSDAKITVDGPAGFHT